MLGALTIAVAVVSAQAAPAPANDDDLRDDGVGKPEVVGPSDQWGRGGSGTVPEWRAQAVSLPRIRFGLGSAGVLGFQPSNYDVSVAGGVGISAEAGVVLGDRISILWRGELTTTVSVLYGANGVLADFAFGDHFAIGFGANFTLWQQLAYFGTDYTRPFSGFTFPLRAHFMFGERKPGVSRREGWTISAHVAPGLTMYPSESSYDSFAPNSYGQHGFAMTAGVGVGYLWW